MQEIKEYLETKKKEASNKVIAYSLSSVFGAFLSKEKREELKIKEVYAQKEYERIVALLQVFEPKKNEKGVHALTEIIQDLDKQIQQRDLIQDVQENEMMFTFRTQQLEYARELIELANKQFKSKTYV